IPHVPAGSYRPVAGAPGYADVALGSAWLPWTRVDVAAGAETLADIVLPDAVARVVPPGQGLAVGDPETLECAAPLPSQAVRRRITFDSGGQPNQTTLLYTPTPSAPPPAPAMRRPLLLTVYPGPADGWECASVPLAAAGYAVLAIGPAYSFDLERDVDDLARLLGLARAGRLPGVDGTRIALLGGSYSALHVQRLLSRGAVAGTVDDVKAVVLLGPPTDLFTMRRRLEDETFIPPFGLDQALIALGFPDWRPLRYWRYSGAFHVRHDQPPTAIIHSRKDEVVPVQQSEFLAAMLAQVGAPHELHIFDEASHYLLSEGGDALAIYQITLDFLARQLG
ncbi:MAG: alpha/beta hydrolase family protein, partial [Chloroflexota bacterium]